MGSLTETTVTSYAVEALREQVVLLDLTRANLFMLAMRIVVMHGGPHRCTERELWDEWQQHTRAPDRVPGEFYREAALYRAARMLGHNGGVTWSWIASLR